ncbi:MAG TPA: hypothetical protein DCM86_19735 [Verrucomicrobiales bacterium]|nr:hypothetical protein [Verrucomicrobiales bacterium]
MKPELRPQSRAFTLIEVLVLVVVTLLLAGVLIPRLHPRRVSAPRISCANNLKQVALAFRIWATDHQERFPWAVPVAEGGTLVRPEDAGREFGDVVDVFRCLSNELTVPKILVCPTDRQKLRAGSFDGLGGARFGGPPGSSLTANLTYLAGWDASEERPATLLSGDPDFTSRLPAGEGRTATNASVKSFSIGAPRSAGIRETGVAWSGRLHPEGGNLGLSDGSVHQLGNGLLQQVLAQAADRGTSRIARVVVPRGDGE